MTADIDIIFKIAGIGIAIAVLNQVLVKAGREEQAMLVTLAGVVIVLLMVVNLISDFFGVIRGAGFHCNGNIKDNNGCAGGSHSSLTC